MSLGAELLYESFLSGLYSPCSNRKTPGLRTHAEANPTDYFSEIRLDQTG